MNLPYTINQLSLGHEVVRIQDNRYIGMMKPTAAGWQAYDAINNILVPMTPTKEEAAEVIWRSHRQRGGDTHGQ